MASERSRSSQISLSFRSWFRNSAWALTKSWKRCWPIAARLPDEAALLKAMNQGQLEAQAQGYARAEATAPPDVQAAIGDLEHSIAEAQARAETATAGGNLAAAEAAEAEASRHAQDLSRLAVADAARQEWREATVAQEAAAREATAELQRRGLAGHIPVTDAEVAETAAEPRPFPVIDPADEARWKAGQTARIQAERRAGAEKMARLTPVTDAELDKYGGQLDPEVSPEAARELADLRQALRDEHHAERGGQAEALARLIPVTDAEVARYGGVRPGDGPQPGPETWAAEKTARSERVRAEREAEAARMGRLVPVTDAEVAAASAEPRDYPAPDPAEVARWRQEQAKQTAQARERERVIETEAEAEAERETPRIDLAEWTAQKALQTAQVEADRQARAEAAARRTPVTDAEADQYGTGARPEAEPGAEAGQDRADVMAGIREEIEALSAKADQLAEVDAEREAERRAEMTQAGIDEPVVHEPQAEPSLEASWQPGDAQGYYEATPESDYEPEMEL